MSIKNIVLILIIFLAVFNIYYLSNFRHQDNFKHQVFLASALKKGRCYLLDYPLKYHDIFTFQNKKYTAFTPFPIILLLPFVTFFGQNTNQVLISMLLGSLNVIILFLILKKLKIKNKNIFFTLIAFAFGSLNWYSSVIGTSWFFSHTVAVFALLFSLLLVFNKKFFSAGLLFGFSFSSRYPVLISLPAMLWLVNIINKKKWLKALTWFILGTIPGLGLIFYYNFCRFGNIWKTGYHYANLAYSGRKKLPSFSLSYLPRNLSIFLFKGWKIIKKFPFLKPDPQGLSIFLTSPFLIFALMAPKKKAIIFPLWLGCFLISAVVFSYFLTGWFQFGPRFSLDFLPFLIILTALGMEKIKFDLVKYLFISLSIVFNLLGVYWGLTLKW